MWEVFLFQKSLPTRGKTPPLYGKSSHIREDFPYMEVFLLRKDPPGIESLPTCGKSYVDGKSSHIREDFPYMGSSIVSLIYCTSACACTTHRQQKSNTTTTAVDLEVGRLPIHGNCSHVWEDFQYMGSKQTTKNKHNNTNNKTNKQNTKNKQTHNTQQHTNINEQQKQQKN